MMVAIFDRFFVINIIVFFVSKSTSFFYTKKIRQIWHGNISFRLTRIVIKFFYLIDCYIWNYTGIISCAFNNINLYKKDI